MTSPSSIIPKTVLAPCRLATVHTSRRARRNHCCKVCLFLTSAPTCPPPFRSLPPRSLSRENGDAPAPYHHVYRPWPINAGPLRAGSCPSTTLLAANVAVQPAGLKQTKTAAANGTARTHTANPPGACKRSEESLRLVHGGSVDKRRFFTR